MSNDPRKATTDGRPPDPACEGSGAPQPIDPRTGQHGAYYVLNEEERRRGFVRPVRHSYKHVGIRPKHATRELTPEEALRFEGIGYVRFEAYPDGGNTVGRYWTQKELDSGCNAVTSMGTAIAETYAREPKFYGSTFCTTCREHLPVAQFVWLDERTGQPTTEVLGS